MTFSEVDIEDSLTTCLGITYLDSGSNDVMLLFNTAIQSDKVRYLIAVNMGRIPVAMNSNTYCTA